MRRFKIETLRTRRRDRESNFTDTPHFLLFKDLPTWQTHGGEGARAGAGAGRGGHHPALRTETYVDANPDPKSDPNQRQTLNPDGVERGLTSLHLPCIFNAVLQNPPIAP